MSKAQQSLNEGNEFLELIAQNDEAEAAHEAYRAKVLDSANSVAEYDRDDMVAMLGDASIGDMMNLKQLFLESLRGERKADWCARMDLVIEKVTEL